MRLKSGSLKLYTIKYFLGEDDTGCKDTTESSAWVTLLHSPFSGPDPLILQNPTEMSPLLEASLTPLCCSWLPLLCCFCTLHILHKEGALLTVSVIVGVYLFHWIMSL